MRERELLEVDRAAIVDRTGPLDWKGKNRYLPYITLVSEFDPVAGIVPTQYSNGVRMVSHKDQVDFIDDIPADNADGVYLVPAGEQKKIAQIVAEVVAAGVAAREFTVTIIKQIGGVPTGIAVMVTGAVALAAGETGRISMFQSGPTWLNDNGVITNEDTNVTGIILEAGDTITATWTNKLADDRCSLSVGEIDLPVI